MHEFNHMLTPILEKSYLENKEGDVMGDFNINMNYATDNPTLFSLAMFVQTVSFYVSISLHVIMV